MTIEKTLVLIKPDAVERKLVGEIIKQYEDNDLKIESLKWLYASDDLIKTHYYEHIGKPFYPELKTFMQSGPMIAIVLSGEEAIARVRKINGATNYKEADCGSIRGHYAHDLTQNLVHGSDTVHSAEKEIAIWFGDVL